jgi:hypothetical protein
MSRRYSPGTFEPQVNHWRFVSWVGRAALSAVLLTAVSCGSSAPANSNTDAASGLASRTPATGSHTVDACRLLTPGEIAAIVGNAVAPGHPGAGPEVCKWDTEQPDQIDVLLMVYLKGGTHEPVLCKDVRDAAAQGKGLPGIGDAATWRFSRIGIDSGDLEVCGSEGFISLSLNGKGEASKFEAAAVSLARKVMARLKG